jgi:hypothetical protein
VISGLGFLIIPGLWRLAMRQDVRRAWWREMGRWGWLYGGLCALLLYGFSAAAFHMMFTYRFFVPYLAPAALAAIHLFRKAGWKWEGRSPAAGVLLVGLLAAQTGLGLLVYHRTLNPTPVDPRLLGFSHGYEYAAESARSYEENFIGAMKLNAADTRGHWQDLAQKPERPPRVMTYAGGVFPYFFRDTYVIENLISYRHNCSPEINRLQRAADYLQILVPRHGPVKSQLAGLPPDLELVSSHEASFDGSKQKFMVYYQPYPLKNPLPEDIRGPCRD